LEKNIKLTEEIYGMTKKIKNYINFQKIMSIVYILLIVVPIILGIIYLPPLLSGVFSQYQDLLGIKGAVSPAGNIDLNKLSELEKYLK